MTKPKFGGNKGKRPAVVVEKRRAKVAKLFAEGKSVPKIAEATGAPLRTIERDLSALRGTLQNANKESFGNFVKGQVELLTRLIEDTYNGTIPPEVANAVRGLMDNLAKLTGSNAPEIHRVFTETPQDQQRSPATLVFVGAPDPDDLLEDDNNDGAPVAVRGTILPPASGPLPVDPTPPPTIIEDVLTRKRRAAGLLLTDGSEPEDGDGTE